MVVFYFLIVWMTSLNFSWLWLLIAIMMQIVQNGVEKPNNKNYWQGDI